MEYTFKGFPQIQVDPEICSGHPHIKGTRVTVAAILAHMAGGMSVEDILINFPRMKKEDIFQALAFAASNTQESFIPIQKAS